MGKKSIVKVRLDGKVVGLSAGKEKRGRLPAVFVHGFSASAEAWQDVMEAELGSRLVLAVTMPGHGFGKNIRKVRHGSVAEMVAHTHSVLDKVLLSGRKPIHLVGTSWGGAITADYARSYPDEVASLTLVAPCGLCTPVTPSVIKAGLGTPTPASVRARMRYVFADPIHITEDKVKETMRHRRQPEVQAGLEKIFPHLLSLPLSNLPADIAARCWLVWGQKDQVVECPPDEVARQLAGEVTLYPDTGHIPQVERMQDFNWRLSTFLRRHDEQAE